MERAFIRIKLGRKKPEYSGAGLKHKVTLLRMRRKYPDLHDPSKWVYLERLSEGKNTSADLYKTPAGRKIVIRSIRERAIVRHGYPFNMLANIIKLELGGVHFERPLGVMRTTTDPWGDGHLEDGTHYITEYVPGKTIYETFKAPPELENKTRLKIAGDILSNLKKMHEAGFVHGHIHSNNILISNKTGYPVFIDPTQIEKISRKEAALKLRFYNDISRFARDAIELGLIKKDSNELEELLKLHYGMKQIEFPRFIAQHKIMSGLR